MLEFAIPTLNDIVAALSMLADVIGEGLVGISLGWAAKPTGIGFIIGLIFLLGFRSFVPVSFEVESLTIVSRIAKRQWHVMIYAVMLAGIIGAILGSFGAYSSIVQFIGPAVQYGMMTGVGIILSIVAIDLIKENRLVGIISAGSAFIIFFATQFDPSNNLIYALAGSVAISVVVGRFRKFEPILPDARREKLFMILPIRHMGQLFRSYAAHQEIAMTEPSAETSIENTKSKTDNIDETKTLQKSPAWTRGGRPVLIKKLTKMDKFLIVRAALSLLALRVGTSIAYPSIDADLAHTQTVTGSGVSVFDATNIMAGLSGFGSAFFGGSPIEPIITGTAAAPNPMVSAAIMMAIAAVILLFGLIGRAARYIPIQSVTGFLLVLGALVIFPSNAPAAMKADPIVGGVSAVVTGATMDPFIGMIAGLIVKGLLALFAPPPS